jgi:hypothetical protein
MESDELLYNAIDSADLEGEKAAAARLLETYYGHMSETPGHGYSEKDMSVVLTSSPVLKIAELSLLQIRERGGRVDPALVGMLSNAAKLEDLLHHADPNLEKRSGAPSHRDAATLISTMADEITMSGLVALPVISRERVSGRAPRTTQTR